MPEIIDFSKSQVEAAQGSFSLLEKLRYVLKLLMELNMHGGPLYTLVYVSQLAF
jgi:hypothetical protein